MASARKLEQDLNTMTDTFYKIVRASHVSEERDESMKQDKKGTGEMTEVLVEKLVVAGQSVLTLIAELKRQALLSDFPALNSAVAARQRDHEAVLEAAEQKIQHLAAEAQEQQPPAEDGSETSELRRLYLLAQEACSHELAALERAGHRQEQGSRLVKNAVAAL